MKINREIDREHIQCRTERIEDDNEESATHAQGKYIRSCMARGLRGNRATVKRSQREKDNKIHEDIRRIRRGKRRWKDSAPGKKDEIMARNRGE